jgi:hypothetical protein
MLVVPHPYFDFHKEKSDDETMDEKVQCQEKSNDETFDEKTQCREKSNENTKTEEKSNVSSLFCFSCSSSTVFFFFVEFSSLSLSSFSSFIVIKISDPSMSRKI